jgi:hypothetical protein
MWRSTRRSGVCPTRSRDRRSPGTSALFLAWCSHQAARCRAARHVWYCWLCCCRRRYSHRPCSPLSSFLF